MMTTIKPTDIIVSNVHTDILNIVDQNAEKILTITEDGDVIWHQPAKANEATELLINSLHLTMERYAGIKKTRQQWERGIRNGLRKAVEREGKLTAEDIDNVFKKVKMIEKLRGEDA